MQIHKKNENTVILSLKLNKRTPQTFFQLEAVYDICRLQTADRRLQIADCMRKQDCKLNETKNIVIKVASSSTLPCSERVFVGVTAVSTKCSQSKHFFLQKTTI